MIARAVAAVGALAVAASSSAARADDPLAGAHVIFARGTALFEVDARGKAETQLAQLPPHAVVRALRTDAGGRSLLANLAIAGGAGKWSWLPLTAGAGAALAELPCAEGPAQLTEDGGYAICKSRDPVVGAVLVELSSNMKTTPLAITAGGARLAATADGPRLIWADSGGVWSAPADSPGRRTKLAPEPPVRGFLASPDGKRAIGVFHDEVYTDVHHTKPADNLMSFPLDGSGARRKAIRGGVGVEWSHDSSYVLVQDGGKACLMRAIGGEYKCWNGYTGESVASDGSFAVIVGNRDPKAAAKSAPAKPSAKYAPKPAAEDAGGEPDAGGADQDVAVPPPSGPLALYRAKLDGPYTDAPVQIVKIADGAAVWVSKPMLAAPAQTPAVAVAQQGDRQCLPVVAVACNCVYACGTGVFNGKRWDVTHDHWKPSTLAADIKPWCVAGTCTSAFSADIVCDVACAPKPADASCHFDAGGACVGATAK